MKVCFNHISGLDACQVSLNYFISRCIQQLSHGNYYSTSSTTTQYVKSRNLSILCLRKITYIFEFVNVLRYYFNDVLCSLSFGYEKYFVIKRK